MKKNNLKKFVGGLLLVVFCSSAMQAHALLSMTIVVQDGPEEPPAAPINDWLLLLVVAGICLAYMVCLKQRISKKV